MLKRQNARVLWLLGIVPVIGFLIVFSLVVKSNTDIGSNDSMKSVYAYAAEAGSSAIEPPASCAYCTRRLLDASLEEIGQFAQKYLAQQGNVRSGTPEVLLVRPVARKDLATLGIACLGSSPTIEDAPWVLVILKGDFDFRSGRGEALVGPGYTAAVFDLWAGDMTYRQYSKDGSPFRLALNDPTLPGDAVVTPLVCPAEVPYTKTLHYGEIAPTPSPPAQLPVLPTITAGISTPVPPPIETVIRSTFVVAPPVATSVIK